MKSKKDKPEAGALCIVRVNDKFCLLMYDDGQGVHGFPTISEGLHYFEAAYHDRLRNPGGGPGYGVRATGALLSSIMDQPSIVPVKSTKAGNDLVKKLQPFQILEGMREWGYICAAELKDQKLAKQLHEKGKKPNPVPPEER